MSENFFGRWSRRKQEAREEVLPPPAAQEVQEAAAARIDAAAPLPAAAGPEAGPSSEAQAEIPPPTLADAEALTPESDFRPFVARNVAPEVKNTAFKKLFADPQFNVMDGMDTYIDDYSQSTPIPDSVLRQMASAKFLRLFEHEEEAEVQQAPAVPAETPQAAAPPDMAQSEPPEEFLPSQQVANVQPASQKTDDHNADLRLQPDDAARAEDARRGAG
ncbi:DUF3306 domain-containing protein [Variovorax paradoxus]|uniref:DUF3306 domain-containing protein n=1 Tax=Variovorax paradoxus TaxID=34073 RepID=UPI003ED01D5C